MTIGDAIEHRRPQLSIAAAPGAGATTLIAHAAAVAGWGGVAVGGGDGRVAWYDGRWYGDAVDARVRIRIVPADRTADVRLRGMTRAETATLVERWMQYHDRPPIDPPVDAWWRRYQGRAGSIVAALSAVRSRAA